MCHGHPCIHPCPQVWVRSDGTSTDWAFDSHGHHFRAHEDRTACGRVVHTHEAAHGGAVNMRYESTPGRQQWLIDQVGSPPAPPARVPVLVQCPLPTRLPAQVHVPALIPVTTHTHTHTHTHHSHTYNLALAQLQAEAVPHVHVHAPAPPPLCGTINGGGLAAKAAAEAAAAAAKRDAAAKDYESAKAAYEAILAHAHEGKDDEWTRYWADLARYYRQLGHQTEAKAASEKRLGAFNIDNFWGWTKP